MPPTASVRACPRPRVLPGPVLLPLLVVLLLAAGLAGSRPAHAHAALVSSVPAAGERVSSVPREVVLRFNEPIAAGLALVTVSDGEGLAMTQGSPAVSGDTVTQPLRPGLLAGTYLVRFKVTSADGHPISDAFSFSVPDAVAAADDPSAGSPGTNSPGTSSPGTNSPGTGSPGTVSPASASGGIGVSADPAAEVSPRARAITTLWLILILAVLALVTVLALIARRGRKARGVHGGHGRFD